MHADIPICVLMGFLQPIKSCKSPYDSERVCATENLIDKTLKSCGIVYCDKCGLCSFISACNHCSLISLWYSALLEATIYLHCTYKRTMVALSSECTNAKANLEQHYSHSTHNTQQFLGHTAWLNVYSSQYPFVPVILRD